MKNIVLSELIVLAALAKFTGLHLVLRNTPFQGYLHFGSQQFFMRRRLFSLSLSKDSHTCTASKNHRGLFYIYVNPAFSTALITSSSFSLLVVVFKPFRGWGYLLIFESIALRRMMVLAYSFADATFFFSPGSFW